MTLFFKKLSCCVCSVLRGFPAQPLMDKVGFCSVLLILFCSSSLRAQHVKPVHQMTWQEVYQGKFNRRNFEARGLKSPRDIPTPIDRVKDTVYGFVQALGNHQSVDRTLEKKYQNSVVTRQSYYQLHIAFGMIGQDYSSDVDERFLTEHFQKNTKNIAENYVDEKFAALIPIQDGMDFDFDFDVMGQSQKEKKRDKIKAETFIAKREEELLKPNLRLASLSTDAVQDLGLATKCDAKCLRKAADEKESDSLKKLWSRVKLPSSKFRGNVTPNGKINPQSLQNGSLPGARLNLRQENGLYSLEYVTNPDFAPETVRHTLNLPIAGTMHIRRIYGEEMQVERSELNNVLIYNHLPALSFTRDHLVEQYTAELSVSRSREKFRLSLETPKNWSPEDSLGKPGEKYRLEYSLRF